MWYSSQNGTGKTQGTTKIQGITHCMYPKVPNVRTGWVVALGVEDWVPKIRSTAAPEVAQDEVNVSHYGEAATLKACRICLATDSKLYPIKMQKLKQAYEHLTGISLQAEDRLPQNLCAECAKRVLSGHRFRNRALRANSLMLEIVHKQDRLTLQDINMLSLKNLTVDEIDKPPPSVMQEEEHESEILKTEGINAEEANDIQENELQAVEFLNDDSQDDFDMALDENSLDDNQLSLQKSKAENIKKKKDVTVKTRIERVNKVIDPAVPKVDGRNKPRKEVDSLVKMFTITDLSFDEQVAKIWRRQGSSNYKNAIYKCTECFKGFLDEDAYKRHLIKHTNHAGEFECEVCKCHFKQPHNLRHHIKAHHTQRFSCKECSYVTSNRAVATLHVRYHKGTTYACPHCPRFFHHSTSYWSHLRIDHPSDFVCEICGYSFISAKGIELHKKLKHKLDNAQVPEDGPFCELCNVRFVSVEAHRRHLRISLKHSTGTERRERNDPTSWPTFNNKKYRRARERVMKKKTLEGPVSCEQCDLQLEDYRAYYFHFRRMHPDKNRTNFTPMAPHCLCEVCGKMFPKNVNLQEHSYVHTGETPFKCETCGKAFHMKARLALHQQVHSTERRTYVCKICGKHFSRLGNRQRHMAIHSGLRPFVCDACGKSYKTDAERKSHFNYVHLKKPWPKRVRGNRRRVTKHNEDHKMVSEVEIDS